MNQHITFFDLDHTLLTVNSSFRFGLYLYREKVISLSCLISLLWNYFLHKCGRLDIYGIHRKSFYSLFENKMKIDFEAYAEKFVDEFYDRLINTEVFQVLLEKKASGEKVVILSSSPDFIVSVFARKMEVDCWDATIYQTNERGRYQSVSRVLEGHEKSKLVRQMAEKYSIPMENTSAYSDSHHDLSFLESVAHPVAVNPTPQLKKASHVKGWQILNTL